MMLFSRLTYKGTEKVKLRRSLIAVSGLFAFAVSGWTSAELNPISDEEMGRVNGQAGIDIQLEDLDINNITLVLSGDNDGNFANGRDFHVIFEKIAVDDLDFEISLDLTTRQIRDKNNQPQNRSVMVVGLKDLSLGNPFTDATSGRYGYVSTVGGQGKVTSGLTIDDVYGADTALGKSDPGCGSTLNCDGQMIDSINLYGQPTMTGNVIIWGRSAATGAE